MNNEAARREAWKNSNTWQEIIAGKRLPDYDRTFGEGFTAGLEYANSQPQPDAVADAVEVLKPLVSSPAFVDMTNDPTLNAIRDLIENTGGGWVEINGPEDLPKESGEYIWVRKEDGRLSAGWYHTDEKFYFNRFWAMEYFSHYKRITPPTSKEEA